MNWDEYFFNMCDVVASRSKDPSTKIGAVITSKNNTIIATGFNGFPKRVYEGGNRKERPQKYLYTVHAEMNAITFSDYAKTSESSTKIYVNNIPPCNVCAGLIINAGIKEVNIINKEVPEQWKASCRVGLEMFIETDVKVKVHCLEKKGYYIFDSLMQYDFHFPFNFENSWGNFISYL